MFNFIKPVTDTINKGLDKITSDKDRAEEANKAIEENKEVDLAHATHNVEHGLLLGRDMIFWVELICLLAFFYTYLLCPIVNDIFNTHFKGAGEQSIDILYALLGLGGYRIAGKIINK